MYPSCCFFFPFFKFPTHFPSHHSHRIQGKKRDKPSIPSMNK